MKNNTFKIIDMLLVTILVVSAIIVISIIGVFASAFDKVAKEQKNIKENIACNCISCEVQNEVNNTK